MMRNRNIGVIFAATMLAVLGLSGQNPPVKAKAATPVATARVEEYILWLPDASLVYEPGRGTLEIRAAGVAVSRGGGWEERQVKPYLYYVRRRSWTRHFWQVNTRLREVRLVWDGAFGTKWQTGALTARDDAGIRENLAVDTVGGGPDRAPERLSIRFPNAQLFFVPSTGAFRLAAAGSTLSPGLEWQSFHLKDDVYQVRVDFWKGYFWQVSTRRLQAWRVHGGGAEFGRAGGQESPLSLTMARSSTPFSLASLRSVLKSTETRELQALARMIVERKPLDRIRQASAEFARKYPDIDAEAALDEIVKEIDSDPSVSAEIKKLEDRMEEVRNKRQEFETAFENYDQKTNQLYNILSAVLKTMKEEQGAIIRNML